MTSDLKNCNNKLKQEICNIQVSMNNVCLPTQSQQAMRYNLPENSRKNKEDRERSPNELHFKNFLNMKISNILINSFVKKCPNCNKISIHCRLRRYKSFGI